MIVIPNIQGTIFGVVGLGKSGRATVASLLASGARVMAWDDGESGRAATAKEFPGITIAPVESWDFSTIASLVMSPGIFLTHPAVVAATKAGVEVIGDVELLYRAQPEATYVGITGTNGKSTTTTLIAHILQACGKRVEVGGNLGTPALALAPLGADGIYVLELSSYQLDLVRTTRFNTAILLNISPDHLDHHGSMENYIAAKQHIFDRMEKTDVAIFGVDDAVSKAMMWDIFALHGPTVIPISGRERPYTPPAEIDPHAYPADAELKHRLASPAQELPHVTVGAATLHVYLHGMRSAASIASIKSLQGQHNWQNAAAAYAACAVNGCGHEAIIAAMQTYPGLAHRMEWLGELNGVQFVNDSKATNADAAEKALKTYDKIHWIIGGVAKEGGIAPLAPYFGNIRHAYVIGEAADDFVKTLEGKVAYTQCGTLEKAFAAAVKGAQKGEAVVLSPACASFDQYPNFEVRGAAFVKLFEALKAGGGHGTSAA